MPNSNPVPTGASAVPSSALRMGEDARASDSIGPGWMVTRWELTGKERRWCESRSFSFAHTPYMTYLPLIVPHLQHVKTEKGSNDPTYKLITTPSHSSPASSTHHPPRVLLLPSPALHRHSIHRYNSRLHYYYYAPLCTSNSIYSKETS